MHALISCAHARGFWDEAQSWLNFTLAKLHPNTWARDITWDPMFSAPNRAKLVTTMWMIWTSRNSWTHNCGCFNHVHSIKLAKEPLAILELPKKMGAMLPGHGWRPLDIDVVKINTDGGLSLEARNGGCGGIARTNSTFLGAWNKPFLGVTDPVFTEAMAL
jgi:hypothetical protein